MSRAKTAADVIAEANGFTTEHVDKLRALVKRGPVEFADLCDAFELPPKRTRALIDFAQAQHITVRISGDRVGIDRGLTEAAVPSVHDLDVSPVVGTEQRIGVISDLHFGSRYCMRPQIAEFVNHAYKEGVRDILVPGDVTEGCYRHAQFELTHSGLEDQAIDAAETLPSRKDLRYHIITGNHDETFWDKTGVNVGRAIVSHFQDHGRDDIACLGDRQAYVKIRGAVIDMWHPKQGCGYAVSYGVQNRISEYTVVKPQILLIGHWHRFCYVYQRGVHGIACPTFQGAGSRYGKSLRGGPSIGGLILSWRLTEHGTIRRFHIDPSMYFERERPIEILGAMDAKEVDPQIYDPTPRLRRRS